MGLNQFSEEYRNFCQDRSLIENMVSAIVRWQTPVLHMRRSTFMLLVLKHRVILLPGKFCLVR